MDLLSVYTTVMAYPNSGPLMEKVVLFLIAFFLVRREMGKQFTGLKDSISAVGEKVAALGETMARVEMSHAERLSYLETEVKEIKTQITKE